METYNFAIRYPRIIGVLMSQKSSENSVIYPAEICEVLPGQFFRKNIAEELQGKVVLEYQYLVVKNQNFLISTYQEFT